MSETILKIKQCGGEMKRYHSRKTNTTSQLEMFKTADFLLQKKPKKKKTQHLPRIEITREIATINSDR